MTADKTPEQRASEKQQRDAEWWAEWHRFDFAWSRLGGPEPQGWGGQSISAFTDEKVPIKSWKGWLIGRVNGADYAVDSATWKTYGQKLPLMGHFLTGRAATLQDYWRADPVTGRLRSDDELVAAGELIQSLGNPTYVYHICHLPLTYPDGTPSHKADWSQEALEQVIKSRLGASAPTHWNEIFYDPEVAALELTGTDHRAQLQGCVLFSAPNSDALGAAPLSIRAEHAAFVNDAYFVDAAFSGLASFEGALFLEVADFSNARFQGGALFDGSAFSRGGKFEGAEFNGAVWFRSFSVVGGARFLNAHFSKSVSFLGAAVFGEMNFFNARMKGFANFGSLIVCESADFTRALFSSNAIFSRSEFLQDAIFHHTKFAKGCWFGNATFGAGALFQGAEIRRTANFVKAVFVGEANFEQLDWKANALFDLSSFLTFAHFEKSLFNFGSSFEGVLFTELVNFENSTFSKAAEFQNSTFSKGAQFDSAAFCSVVVISDSFFGGETSFRGAPLPLSEPEKQQSLGLEWAPRKKPDQEAGQEVTLNPAWDGALKTEAQILPLARRAFPRIDATGAIFAGDVDFSDRDILSVSSFDKAHFYGAVAFHGGKLHQGASFLDAKFADALKYPDTDHKKNTLDTLVKIPAVHLEKLHLADVFLRRSKNESAPSVDDQEDKTEAFKNDYANWQKEFEAERRASAFASRVDKLNAAFRQISSADPNGVPELKVDSKGNPTDISKWKDGERIVRNERFAQLESAFRTLKLAMEERRDRIEEGRFFKLELQARNRRKEMPIWRRILYKFQGLSAPKDENPVTAWERFFSGTYGLIADYGNSIARPLVLLMAMIPFMAVLFLGVGGWVDRHVPIAVKDPAPCIWTKNWDTELKAIAAKARDPASKAETQKQKPVACVPLQQKVVAAEVSPLFDKKGHLRISESDWHSALTFSWNNVFRPLSALSAEGVAPYEPSWASALLYGYGTVVGFWLRALATVQSLLSILFIFFGILAVRRRFQIN